MKLVASKHFPLLIVAIASAQFAWAQAKQPTSVTDIHTAAGLHKKKQPPKPRLAAHLPPIVSKAMSAAKRLTFSAVRVVSGPKGQIRENVFVTPGMMRVERGDVITITKGKTRTVYNKKNNTVRRMDGGVTLGDFQPGMRRISANTAFTLTENQSVAGRPSTLVAMHDPGMPNDTQEVYIDSETGLVLKASATFGPEARPMSYEVESVDYSYHPSAQDFANEFPGAKLISPRDDLARVSGSLKIPAYTIPDSRTGYTLVRAEKREIAGTNFIHQTFRGGGNVVSLFTISGDISPDRLKKAAGNQHFTTWKIDTYNFVLIGNLGDAELDALRSSVTL